MKNWKRRYFLLDENAVSYFKTDQVNVKAGTHKVAPTHTNNVVCH